MRLAKRSTVLRRARDAPNSPGIDRGSTMRRDVEFKSNGITLRAHLYLPEGTGPFPLVDGYTTMKSVHSALAFRNLQDLLIDDRRKRQRAGEYGTMPMSTEDPAK